jgi:hypothetical protein
VTTELISPDLQSALRRLRLSGLAHTLPERLALAKEQNIPHQDFCVFRAMSITDSEGCRSLIPIQGDH